MNNRILLVLSILVLGLSSFGGAPTSETGDQAAVLKAARLGLPVFLKELPEDQRPHFGMFKPEDIFKAEPGLPFPVYTLDPKDLRTLSASRTLGTILKETGDWYVPVLVDREWRLLLTVSKMEGKWQTVGISEADLAAEIGMFQARWLGLAEATAVPRESGMKFLRVFQASADFMYVLAPGREFLWPFQSGLRALEIVESDLMTAEVALPLLKTAIREKN
ncbi:MAG: hypothetical protein MUQ00_04820 [Candidatus Aminicenantes bacterium]|nr:hypothetical protein [Candidatus Aminicenantes bacterium]